MPTGQLPPSPDTHALVRAAAAAPRQGFPLLHQRTATQLRLWAALHLGPSLRTWLPLDDFVQEVWARAYAAFGRYEPARGSFRAWLLGIAANVLREQLRQRRGRAVPAAAALPPEVATAPGTTVVTRVDRRLAWERVVALADTLPAADRLLLAWRGLEQLEFEVVGARLGITAAAAECRWRRLVVRLREGYRPAPGAG